MTSALMPQGRQRYYNNDGTLAAGCYFYTYIAGTTTPKTVWQDSAGTVPHPNPIVLDAKGEAVIYWDGAYKADLKTAAGVQITGWPVDNIVSDPAGLGGFPASLAAAAGAGLVGFITGTVYAVNTVGKFLQSLTEQGGSALMGFIQAGAGAIKRWAQDKMRERVSVADFGATGVGNLAVDRAAIQAAIDSFGASVGELFIPRGLYILDGSLKLASTQANLRIVAESPGNTYFLTPNGSAFDILKIAAAYSHVEGILFRPGGDQLCVRLYAAHCTFTGNRLLSDVNNVGTMILVTDIDPDTAAFVSGAYTHNFDNNVIGVAGFAPAIGIDCSSTAGLQAMKFTRNQIMSDRCINMSRGGANTYVGNLLQSSTGAGTGIGIDVGANAVGEKIFGNYFEGFAQAILLRPLGNASQVAHATGNHFDGCTSPLTSLGTVNYLFENAVGTLTTNSWVDNYSSYSYRRWPTPSGGEGMVLTSGGIFQVGTTLGVNHTFNTIGAIEGSILSTWMGAGTSASFMRHVLGTGANGANCGYSVRGNSVTLRGINSGGTVNASGADYAEYMKKSWCCFDDIKKGQIVFATAAGEITDNPAHAVPGISFVKSTNPSFVGGDFDNEQQPEQPAPALVKEAPVAPGLNSTARAKMQYNVALAAYQAEVLKAEADHAGQLAAWHQAMDAWTVRHEAMRAQVDRIAYCGQVPVNVWGAKPGDLILPDNGGEAWDMLNDPEVPEWAKKMHRSVGKVLTIEADGRARIIVKVS